jgi:hypothetical protein
MSKKINKECQALTVRVPANKNGKKGISNRALEQQAAREEPMINFAIFITGLVATRTQESVGLHSNPFRRFCW